MKGLVYTTGTVDTEKLIRSFTSVVPETKVFRYDVHGFDVVAVAEHIRPDIIVYIGAIGKYHHSPVPETETLCKVNHIAPMIHLCSDSADPPWWPLLEEYNIAGAFKLQVGIDGCFDSPLAKFGKIALTPIDPSSFSEVSWDSRTNICGFAGGGGSRTWFLEKLKSQNMLVWLPHAAGRTYDEMCKFYTTCQMVINDASTGSGQARHIKGRFVEAGLAGAVPIEPFDSPARQWFKANVDYIEWMAIWDVEKQLTEAKANSARNEDMGRRLRIAMLEKHSGPVFWKSIFKEIGL